jgi:hypothetical protein
MADDELAIGESGVSDFFSPRFVVSSRHCRAKVSQFKLTPSRPGGR